MSVERGAVASPAISTAHPGTDPLRLSPTAATRRIRELDGIRGIAILLVLVCHFVVNLVASPPRSLRGYAIAALDLSWSGVDLFFVLSGFLIGGILLDVRESPRYYRTFYTRRASRILPLYAVLLVALSLGAAWLTPMQRQAAWLGDLPPVFVLITFTQNVWMAVHGAFGGAALAPTWSLAVEEQFYLVLPPIVRRTSERTLARFCVVMIVAAPLVRAWLNASGIGWLPAYTLMPARADALAWGVLMAILWRQGRLAVLGLSAKGFGMPLLVVSFGIVTYATARRLNLDNPFVSTLGIAAFGALYAVFIAQALLAADGGLLRRALRHPLLTRLGAIAYGTYLLHQPFLGAAFATLTDHSPRIVDLADLGVASLALIATIVVAHLSWTYMEAALVQRGHRARY